MSETSKLNSLLDLIGNEGTSINVSLNDKLDEHAVKELNNLRKYKSAVQNANIWNNLKEQFQCSMPAEDEASIWSYTVFIYGILLEIDQELETFEDLPISVNDTKKVYTGIRKCIEYGLKPYLLAESVPIQTRLPYIITNTKILLKLVNNKFFPVLCTRNNQHLLYTDLLSSIFIILCNVVDEPKCFYEEKILDIRKKLSHSEYFKILFIIKGSNTNRCSLPVQHLVHTQLKEALYQTGSFQALCEALLPPVTSLEQDEEIAKKRLHSSHVVASIVAQKAHGRKFHHQIINEIHLHLLDFIRKKDSRQVFFQDVAVRCLSRLYSLQLKHIQNHVLDILLGNFGKLANPTDLVAGAIVCDGKEFLEMVHIVHLTFCASGPSDDTLPSLILMPFMPIFIQIHNIISASSNKSLKNELIDIITRCLSNRNRSELGQIIEWVLYEEYGENVKYLHQRLIYQNINNDGTESVRFIVDASSDNTSSADFDIDKFLRPPISMLNVLKKCNHNMLIYDVFLQLLEMFSRNINRSEEARISTRNSTELLEHEIDLQTAIDMKFRKRYSVIHLLNELILFKPFHAQFVENPNDISSTLEKMIQLQLEQIKDYQLNQKPFDDDFVEMLTVILLCTGEFIQHVNDIHKEQLIHILNKLWLQLQHDRTKNDVAWNVVLKKLDDLLHSNQRSSENSEFCKIKNILSETSSEPYTKVYGIMNMIKLLESKDEETISNAHIVLVLAMKMLQEEDSYIFLNCIKLLLCLFNVLGGTVLETLIAEYHLDIDAESSDIDFKLKVGEAIVKVVIGLGEMSYKYKDMLIDCFLRGVYNRNNEFRTSNMSNLGSILRSLSYQVHHFFQEIISFIQNTLLQDDYVPARRSAALVLSDLIQGMQSLEQYKDFLLPIYRNLKNISENDPDLHTRIHARNGLAFLKDKVKEELTAETKMEKEIRIFGIDSSTNSVKYK